MIDRLSHWWKRRVVDRPDFYRAYVRLPALPSGPDAMAATARAHEFEAVCDGRLDVYGSTRAFVVETDFVPANRFDLARFEVLLDAVQDCYPSDYRFRRVERWVRHEGHAAKTFLVSPVKPMFPDASGT